MDSNERLYQSAVDNEMRNLLDGGWDWDAADAEAKRIVDARIKERDDADSAFMAQITEVARLWHYVPVNTAALMIGVTEDAVRKAIKRGRLPAIRHGRMHAIHTDDVERYANAERDKGGRPKQPH